MKKTLVSVLALALVVGALALPGQAAARKGRKPKAISTTLYFHGSMPLGEIDEATDTATLSFMTMDPKAPTDSQSKSKSFGWANTGCSGNRGFVTWLGNVSGTIVGDIDLDFTALSIPQDIEVRVWPDVTETLCAANYPNPAIDQVISVPSGQGEIKVALKSPTGTISVSHSLMIQLSPAAIMTDTPGPGRVFYDGTSDPSHITFMCVPASGAAACS